MSHANACLTPTGRLRLAQLVVDKGWTLRRAAERWNCSVTTARRWADALPRLGPRRHGRPVLASPPLAAPDPDATRATRDRDCGSHAAGDRPGSPTASAWLLDGAQGPAPLRLPAAEVDRPGHRHPDQRPPMSRRVTNAYVHDAPGDLVHVDIKKLGRIPDGGGWRIHGRGSTQDRRAGSARDKAARAGAAGSRGYAYIHHAVDDHSRLAYSEIHADERKETAVGFWRRARAFFAAHGITVRAVLTDNGSCYRSKLWAKTLDCGRDQAPPDPSLPAPDQRQGRTVQPHPARGVGLRPRVPLRGRTRSRLPRLAPHLQSPPRPHRTQGQVTSRPRAQPAWTEQLGPRGPAGSGSTR